MKNSWVIAVALLAACASIGGTAPVTRQFDAPLARVKPAFITTLSSMGMMITAIEVRGSHEILKAKKGGSEVQVELEPLGRTATRASVGARSGGLLYDEDAADRILRQAGRLVDGR